MFLCVLLLFSAEFSGRCFFWIAGKEIEVYRNFSIRRKPYLYVFDSLLGKRLKPNAVGNAYTSDFQMVYRTNRFGMREKQIHPNSKIRILFLGDSQTFGEGVSEGERFSDLVEKNISSLYSMNAGIPGYGMHQMLGWLRTADLQLAPDLVLVCFIPADLHRTELAGRNLETHFIENSPPASSTKAIMALQKIMKTSYLYSYFKVRYSIGKISKTLRSRDQEQWQHLKEKNAMDQLTEYPALLKAADSIFSGFKEYSLNNCLPIVAVNIGTLPLPKLEMNLKKIELPYIDLSTELGRADNIRFELDPHYNGTGHQIIAQQLVQSLEPWLRKKPKNCPE